MESVFNNSVVTLAASFGIVSMYLLFIPLMSISQDKFTVWGGKLRVTENNVWIRSFHPENNLKELAAKLKNNDENTTTIVFKKLFILFPLVSFL